MRDVNVHMDHRELQDVGNSGHIGSKIKEKSRSLNGADTVVMNKKPRIEQMSYQLPPAWLKSLVA